MRGRWPNTRGFAKRAKEMQGRRRPKGMSVGGDRPHLVPAPYCDVCSRTEPHIHCPECGSVEHVAADCDGAESNRNE